MPCQSAHWPVLPCLPSRLTVQKRWRQWKQRSKVADDGASEPMLETIVATSSLDPGSAKTSPPISARSAEGLESRSLLKGKGPASPRPDG